MVLYFLANDWTRINSHSALAEKIASLTRSDEPDLLTKAH
jgi:hypothetical protein